MEPWQHKAQEKRNRLAAAIPEAWRIAVPPDLQTTPTDVRSFPSKCSFISPLELAITEEDDIQVLLRQIGNAKWKAREVMEAYCKRAAVAHQLTLCLTEPLFDRALDLAAELDASFAKTGELKGPLHGLPVSVKEQFDIKGVESTMGFVSKIGRISTSTAVLVELLESLGAIVFCRTNIPQALMSDESGNNIFGRTLNPWNTFLTAGGSSGGEAALLAMKGSPLGIGTDAGGSIRKPASFCGLYSLRPTPRRIPFYGASNICAGSEALESVCGPMARSANSLDVFMRAVVEDGKPWQWDSKVVEKAWKAKDERKETKKKCFAVMWWDGLVRCNPPIERGLREVVAALRAEGHDVIQWEALDHAAAQEIVFAIFGSDGGANVKEWLGDSGEPLLPQVFASSPSPLSINESWALNLKRDQYRQRFLQAYMATEFDPGNSTGRPIDAILCGTAPHVAAPHLECPRPAGLISYTTVWSLLEVPCYTFPVGVVDPVLDAKPTDDEYHPRSEVDKANWEGYSPELYWNAPIVLQLVGRRFAEDELIHLGLEVERALVSQGKSKCMRVVC